MDIPNDRINFSCPSCGRQLVVDRRQGGKKGRCSGCHNIILIPTAEEPQGHDDSSPSADLNAPQAPRQTRFSSPAPAPHEASVQNPEYAQPSAIVTTTSPAKKSRRKLILIAVIVGFLLIGVGIPLSIVLVVTHKPDLSAQEIFERSKNSVVLVGTNRAVGSGFVVSSGNLILTNSHVIYGHDEKGNKVIVEPLPIVKTSFALN